VKRGGKWGYIDRQGEMVIPLAYHEAGHFRGDYVPVAIKKIVKPTPTWAFIGRKGMVRIKPLSESFPLAVGDSTWWVNKRDNDVRRWGMVRLPTKGIVVEYKYEDVVSAGYDFWKCRRDAGMDFVDSKGHVVAGYEFSRPAPTE